jgi:hypothetical protein
METWRKIPGYAGEASSEGRIRSKYRVLKGCPGPSGKKYLRLSLIREADGRRQVLYVHRLVAFAFLPPPTSLNMWVLHKDDDVRNNRPENLYWGTALDNARDRARNTPEWWGGSTREIPDRCPQGHPYAGDNLAFTREGYRRCRECNRVRSLERYYRQQSEKYG